MSLCTRGDTFSTPHPWARWASDDATDVTGISEHGTPVVVRWVFRRGGHEVTTIEVVRTRQACVVTTTEANGLRCEEVMPSALDAVLRQADRERQLLRRGWHLASFDHGRRT